MNLKQLSVSGYNVFSLMMLSPARYWFQRLIRTGEQDDAFQAASVSILEHGPSVGHIASALRTLVRNHDRNQVSLRIDGTSDDNEASSLLLDRHAQDPSSIDLDTPADPFELIDELDRPLVRDAITHGYRSAGTRHGITKSTVERRVNRSLRKVRARHALGT